MKKYFIFVSTNIVITIMRIEEIIKSSGRIPCNIEPLQFECHAFNINPSGVASAGFVECQNSGPMFNYVMLPYKSYCCNFRWFCRVEFRAYV